MWRWFHMFLCLNQFPCPDGLDCSKIQAQSLCPSFLPASPPSSLPPPLGRQSYSSSVVFFNFFFLPPILPSCISPWSSCPCIKGQLRGHGAGWLTSSWGSCGPCGADWTQTKSASFFSVVWLGSTTAQQSGQKEPSAPHRMALGNQGESEVPCCMPRDGHAPLPWLVTAQGERPAKLWDVGDKTITSGEQMLMRRRWCQDPAPEVLWVPVRGASPGSRALGATASGWEPACEGDREAQESLGPFLQQELLQLPASLSSLCFRDSSGGDGKRNVICGSPWWVSSRSDCNLLGIERDPTNITENTINHFAIWP